MTSQSPRIYTYKITFEEVPYFYYGSKKEKYFDQPYMGSPVTNKWCWDFYTPKKQILEIFDYTDEGYIKAQEVEGRLIRAVYNTDKWCLNERCGGKFSLDVRRKTGLKSKENGTGCFGITPEKRIEARTKAGKNGSARCKELGVGIFAFFVVINETANSIGARSNATNGTHNALNNVSATGNSVFNIIGIVLIIGAIMSIVGLVYNYVR